MNNIKFHKNKKNLFITSIVSIFGFVTLSAIIIPLLLNNKDDFKHDKIIEIWTTNSEKDQFFNSFNEKFVNEFNKNSDYEVKLVTISPQNSLASDIAIKMEAKGKVPNLFIGIGQDSIYLSEYENNFVSLLNIEDYTDSLVLDNYEYYYDEFQQKNIKPFAPLMINGEALYINNLQMNSFIKFVENNSLFIIDDSFKLIFSYNSSLVENEYFSNEKIIDNNVLNYFTNKYSSLNKNIFNSFEGLIDLSRLIHSLLIDDTKYSIGFDNDVSAAQYLTFNYVDNNFDDWMFNTSNDLNFIDSEKSQDAYSKFVDSFQFLVNEGDMWIRENNNTNPTLPFINDELTMFIGANFNAKYVNSELEDQIQYDETTIIKTPKKILTNQKKNLHSLKQKH